MKCDPIFDILFVDVFNKILKIEQRILKKGEFSDLTITEIHTLVAIEQMVNRKMKDIADKLSITLSTLTTAVNNLLKKGYVIQKRGNHDKRIMEVFPTEKGKNVIIEHNKFHDEMIRSVLKNLSGDEISSLEKALNNIYEYFNGQMECV